MDLLVVRQIRFERPVGKKKIDLMKKMKGEFIEGAVKHSNADRGKVEAFWEHLEEFANYCFNKSHAACLCF